MVSVARLLGGPDADLVDVLTRIIGDQHVPYLAQLRYSATGMRNRAQWEKTWAKQREEDAKGIRLDIDVPPKYKREDFARGSYWSQRGKLDVPKERFISYPLASPDGTALKFSGLWGLVSGFRGLVTIWLHVGRGGVTGCGGP